MLARVALLVLAVVCVNRFVFGDDAQPTDSKDGFVSLFDGKTLEGWTVIGKPEGWTVKDGVIHSDGGKGGNWLRSAKPYKDFVLKLEWKISAGGNSGVFIRANKEGAPWVTGYEVQILDAKSDATHCSGSLYGFVAPKPRPDHTPGKWHTYEIRCQGNRIVIIADGVKRIDYDQSTSEKTKNKPLAGYIGLQDSHSAKGHDIQFRKLRIKSLD